VLRELSKVKGGISFLGKKLTCLAFADDLVLMANSATSLQDLLHRLESMCASMGLTINPAKCAIHLLKNSSQSLTTFKLQCGTPLTILQDREFYTYLGKRMVEKGNATNGFPDLIKDLELISSSLLSPFLKIQAINTFICRSKHSIHGKIPAQ
jgi:hypothetical protein